MAALLASSSGLQRALAQVFVATTVNWAFNSSADEDKVKPSFTLPSQSTDIKDAMDEFTRLVRHEQWERAFKSLETITAKTSTGFIDRGDGVLVPSRLLVRGLLAGLPSAGKNAYRLFYDAQAQALLDKATGKAEAEYLAMIVNNHLISSVGDYAADRLGDLFFERGEFEQAIVAWQSILAYCPESKLSKAQLYVKIGTALARANRWKEFRDIQSAVVDRYAAETVEMGGRRFGGRRNQAPGLHGQRSGRRARGFRRARRLRASLRGRAALAVLVPEQGRSE